MDFWSSGPHLPGAGFVWRWGWNPGLHAHYAKGLPTKSQPQLQQFGVLLLFGCFCFFNRENPQGVLLWPVHGWAVRLLSGRQGDAAVMGETRCAPQRQPGPASELREAGGVGGPKGRLQITWQTRANGYLGAHLEAGAGRRAGVTRTTGVAGAV